MLCYIVAIETMSFGSSHLAHSRATIYREKVKTKRAEVIGKKPVESDPLTHLS